MAKRSGKSGKSFGTLQLLAAALRVPVSTAGRWVKDERWRWARKAPWSAEVVPEVLRWAAESLERGRPEKAKDPAKKTETQKLRDEKLRQEIRKLRAHADQAETELATGRGKLHDADACDEEKIRFATLVRNGVQNIPTQATSMALSQCMPHAAAPMFQKQMEELCNGCLRYLAAGDPAEDQEAPPDA